MCLSFLDPNTLYDTVDLIKFVWDEPIFPNIRYGSTSQS